MGGIKYFVGSLVWAFFVFVCYCLICYVFVHARVGIFLIVCLYRRIQCFFGSLVWELFVLFSRCFLFCCLWCSFVFSNVFDCVYMFFTRFVYVFVGFWLVFGPL